MTKRYFVFNKKTQKTRRYFATREQARAWKRTQSNSTMYGIFNVARDSVIR